MGWVKGSDRNFKAVVVAPSPGGLVMNAGEEGKFATLLVFGG